MQITPGGSWQGSTLSADSVDGDKPTPLPKPALIKKPGRPAQPPKRPNMPPLPRASDGSKSFDDNIVPLSPHSAPAEPRKAPMPVPRRSEPPTASTKKSATLGRSTFSSASDAPTDWSSVAGDLLGQPKQTSEHAPRVPARPMGHNRGYSMGDPRQAARITGVEFSPPLPPREKHHQKKEAPAVPAQVAEPEGVREGHMSEIKKKLEGIGSPTRRAAAPAPVSHGPVVPVAEGSVAAHAAGLAQVLQGEWQ